MTVTATDTDGLFTDAVFVFTINASQQPHLSASVPIRFIRMTIWSQRHRVSMDGDGQAVSYAYDGAKTACLKASPAALSPTH